MAEHRITNAGIAAAVVAAMRLVGGGPFMLAHLPLMLLAASIGVWLFYVQHQFEETFWAREQNWTVHEAALHGSSQYALPPVLQWMSATSASITFVTSAAASPSTGCPA